MSQQLMQLMLHNISNKHNFTKFKHCATHKTVFSCINFFFNRKFSDTFRTEIVIIIIAQIFEEKCCIEFTYVPALHN